MNMLELNQFPSVSASGVATLVTDELIDQAVHAIIFERGGTTFTAAHMTNIRLRVDGKDLVNGITGAQLDDLNDYAGIGASANYCAYFFGDPTARTIRGQHLGDLDLSVYRKPIEIEVEIGAATAPTLKCYALTSVPKADMGIGYSPAEVAHLRALVRTVIQPAAAVSRKSYGISMGSSAGARVRSLNFFHTNLTSAEMKKQGLTKFDDIKTAPNSAVQTFYARAPQAGLYVIDRIVDGNQGEAETTVRPDGNPWNLQVSLTTSGADTITTFADLHTTLPQL